MAANILVRDVTISPNPVQAKGKYTISVSSFTPTAASVSSTGAEPSALTNAHTASPPAAKGAVSLSRLAAKKRISHPYSGSAASTSKYKWS